MSFNGESIESKSDLNYEIDIDLRNTNLKCPISGTPLYRVDNPGNSFLFISSPDDIIYISFPGKSDWFTKNIFISNKNSPYIKYLGSDKKITESSLYRWSGFDPRDRYFLPKENTWEEFSIFKPYTWKNQLIAFPVEIPIEECYNIIGSIISDNFGPESGPSGGFAFPISTKVISKTISFDLQSVKPMDAPSSSIFFTTGIIGNNVPNEL